MVLISMKWKICLQKIREPNQAYFLPWPAQTWCVNSSCVAVLQVSPVVSQDLIQQVTSLVFRVRVGTSSHSTLACSHVFCQQVFNSQFIGEWVNFQVSQQLMVNYHGLSHSFSLCEFHCASFVTSFPDELRGYCTKSSLSSFCLNSVIEFLKKS